MHHNIHTASFEELNCPFANVLEVGITRCNNMDHAEDALFDGVAVGMVMIVVV